MNIKIRKYKLAIKSAWISFWVYFDDNANDLYVHNQ